RRGDDVWTNYSAATTDDDGSPPFTGLVGDNVQAVVADGDRVWVGSAEAVWNGQRRGYDDGGVSVFDGEKWTARTVASTGGTEAGLRSGGVAALAVGCDGALWIGSGTSWTDGAGVDVLVARSAPHDPAQDAWGRFAFPDLASDEVAAMAADCAGAAMWVGSRDHSLKGDWSDGGLARFAAATGAWSRFDAADGLESYSAGRIRGEALSVAVAPGGGVWVGSFGTRRMTQEELIATAPYWPAVVNRFTGDRWSHTIFEDLGRVGSVAVAADGTVWAAATRGGAARDSVDPENWRSDRRLPGVLLLAEDGVWRGLDEHTGGLPANDVSVVAVDPEGGVWVGTEGWGLGVYRPGEAPSTATPTTDAPSPTPSPPATLAPSPGTSATPGGTPTATAVGPGATATATGPRPTPAYRIFLPAAYVSGGA
ncbi:MAG: two-component regulator propeller domain-containing protein, partial [Anaerolineae bacterium]